MKKALMCTLLISVLCLLGCEAQPMNIESKEVAVPQSFAKPKAEVEPVEKYTDDSWKYEVAERLYKEFCYFYEHRNDDMSNDEYYVNYPEPLRQHTYTNYNVMMAADRAEGVVVYRNYLSEDKVRYVLEKVDELNEKLDWVYRVCFGYSKNGMHYIAILYNHVTNSYCSSPMCDKIRGDYNESNFMDEVFSQSHYVQDVFVEDLSKQKNEFDLELQFSNDFYFEFEPLEEISSEVKNIITKYNRNFISNKNTTVKNGTWNVWMTERLVGYLSITCDGEKTVLKHYAPTQQ